MAYPCRLKNQLQFQALSWRRPDVVYINGGCYYSVAVGKQHESIWRDPWAGFLLVQRALFRRSVGKKMFNCMDEFTLEPVPKVADFRNPTS